MNKVRTLMAVGFVLVLILGAFAYFGCSKAPAPVEKTSATDNQTAQLYACPMHPDQTSTDPNAKCPVCGMKMEPVKGGGTPSADDKGGNMGGMGDMHGDNGGTHGDSGEGS
jgi:hypothetical protein